MPFNRIIKYFKTIRAFVHCDICNDVIGMDIDKELIRNGLETGIFMYRHVHKNKNPDPDDSDDQSWQEHSCSIYIDGNYQIKKIQCFFGDDAPVSAKEGDRIPVCIKKIPEASVRIGMVTREQYKLLQLCDGNNTLTEIAQITEIGDEDLIKMMDELRDKGLIDIIIRS